MDRVEAAANARQKQLDQYDGDKDALLEAQRERGRKTGLSNKGKKVGYAANRERAAASGRLSGYVRRMNKRSQNR